VPFTPQPGQPFTFGLTLDGVGYQASVTWGLFGQRWFLNILTLQGALVLSRALIASPAGADQNLVWGYFSVSTVVFRDGTNQFEITP
jgi:hypothetical protein